MEWRWLFLDEAYLIFAPEGSSLAEWVAEWPEFSGDADVIQGVRVFGGYPVWEPAFTSEPIGRLLNVIESTICIHQSNKCDRQSLLCREDWQLWSV